MSRRILGAALAAMLLTGLGLIGVLHVVELLGTPTTTAQIQAVGEGEGAPAPTSDDATADAFGGALDVAAADQAAERMAAREINEEAARQSALNTALDAYAATVPAQFAVAVLDHRTGVLYTYNPDLAVRTASVVKVDILAALILSAQDNGRPLSAEEQRLASAMIRNSDNDAADALWWSIGGDTGLAASDARLGLTATVPGTGGYWGATTTTVTDRIRLLDVISDPAGPFANSRDYILGLMESVEGDQAWGVSASADGEDTVALKNGWVDADDGWLINSTGRITGPDTDITIAILSQHEDDYSSGVAVVEQIAGLTRSALAS